MIPLHHKTIDLGGTLPPVIVTSPSPPPLLSRVLVFDVAAMVSDLCVSPVG